MDTHKIQGAIFISMSLVLFMLGLVYTSTSESIISKIHKIGPSGECIHPPDTICPIADIEMLSTYKHIGVALNCGLLIFGFFLLFRRKERHSIAIVEKSFPDVSGEEKRVIDFLLQSKSFVFQNELSEQLSMSRVQLTRILDKLEARGLIERRRRGMTNAVLLK